MKTLKYLLATMLLLGVCSLTHSQKLSLGIFPEPPEVAISSQTYAPPHGYTLRGINNPERRRGRNYLKKRYLSLNPANLSL